MAGLTAQIRCREVAWKSRWYWGLRILNADTAHEFHEQSAAARTGARSGAAPTQSQILGTYQASNYPGREIEKWLTGLRISAREEEKPALLHAVVLHLIRWGRYRSALDELET